MTLHSPIPLRAATERNIHDIWAEEEAALPTQAERLARVQAFAAECDRAYEARAPQREREAARLKAKQDELFAQLSKQFVRMWGEGE